jgi:pimeloyl-ACP methyl ester carboxylesterase
VIPAIVLIPGSGGDRWSWQPVAADLIARGHEVVAVDLPAADEASGLVAYADTVLAAIGPRTGCVLAAASLGAFTLAMVCARIRPGGIALLNAMIPKPGETPGQWWGNVGSESYRTAAATRGGYRLDVDLDTYFFHDLPADLAVEAHQHVTAQSGTPFADPCRFDAWPDVPTIVLTGRGDRFFPAALQQAVARQRLGIEPQLVPGGHLASVSHPGPIADRLAALTRIAGPAVT